MLRLADEGLIAFTGFLVWLLFLGLKVHKPTAFDGLQQGWGTDPWWVASGDRYWGLTKHGTKEVVMGAARLSCFANRRLVLPAGGR